MFEASISDPYSISHFPRVEENLVQRRKTLHEVLYFLSSTLTLHIHNDHFEQQYVAECQSFRPSRAPKFY